MKRLPKLITIALLSLPALASAQKVQVISSERMQELGSEAKTQLNDARRVHRRDSKILGYTAKEILHGETPSMIRRGKLHVELKDGTKVEFPWYRVGFAENKYANTDKTLLAGPGAKETNKGGIRIHEGVFHAEVEALALKMDRKIRLSGDAIGGWAVRGAKGGIGAGKVVSVGKGSTLKIGEFIDPASPGIDRNTLIRKFGSDYRKTGGQVGVGSDIQAGDVNTKQPVMMALAKRYARIQGSKAPSFGVSGKAMVRLPNGKIDPQGGIEYRAISTGEGVAMAAKQAAVNAKLQIKGATVVSQGWGEVGEAFGMALSHDKARVIGIEERWLTNGKVETGLLEHPKGQKATHAETVSWLKDVKTYRTQWSAHLADSSQPAPDLRTFKGGALLKGYSKGKSVFQVKSDVVGINALGGTVTSKAVASMLTSGTTHGSAKVYVEGANLAATTEGAKALDKAQGKIVAVPGDLANVGGVHVSNIEAIQNITGKVVSNELARHSLDTVIRKAWQEAQVLAKQHDISIRAAVELLATSRMMKTTLQKADAMKLDIKSNIFGSKSKTSRAKQVIAKQSKARFPKLSSKHKNSRSKAFKTRKAKARTPRKFATRKAR